MRVGLAIATAPDMTLFETDAASLRVLHALQENARLARATMMAIDCCVESAIRLLRFGPGGPRAARRRAAELGLDRLEDYLRQMKRAAAKRPTMSSVELQQETRK